MDHISHDHMSNSSVTPTQELKSGDSAVLNNHQSTPPTILGTNIGESHLFATADDGTPIPFVKIAKCCLDESNLLYFKLLWTSDEMNESNPSLYWTSFQECPEAASLVSAYTETASVYCTIVGIENFGTPTLSEMRQVISTRSNHKETS